MNKKTFGNTPPIEPVKPRGIIKDFESASAKVEPKAPKKPKKRIGRPPNKEKLVSLTIYLTEKEVKRAEEKSGLAGKSKHIVAFLREKGYFE